jgi:xanthine dehydrogenase YagR molybdenum-binding subunit
MARRIIKTKRFFEEGEVEHMAEVNDNEYQPWPNNDQLDYIGKPIPRLDGYEKVSGTAVYAYDKILPNMAYAKTLRCPHAHARITSIDVSAAKKIKGVLDVITHENTEEIRWWGRSYLFDTHLRYQGDEVACVAAETSDIAEAAIRAIQVEYEILDHVVDAQAAMEDDAPKLYDNGNIQGGQPGTYSRGDVEQGFQDADATFEETYTTPVQMHEPTEPHCSVVNWEGDRLTVWDSTQNVFGVRNGIAGALDVHDNKVRVIKDYMGGGFGGKLEAGKYSVMAAILARNIGRPVSIYVDRKGMSLAMGNRPDSVMTVKGGVKQDGTLTAMTLRSVGAAGAYPAGAGTSAPMRQMYKCANVSTEEYTVYINAGRGRPFRAPGRPQGFFSLESMLDELAEQIGMDPLDLRKKNFTDVDPRNNKPYSSNFLMEAYDQGAAAIGWSENRNQEPGSGSEPVKRGLGLSSQIWGGSGGPPAYVNLKLNRDGSAVAESGTQDIGTGTYTIIAQAICEVLEIPMDQVEVMLGDTSTMPYGPTSGGSQTAPSISPAARDAAEQMRDKLMQGAAASMDVAMSDLTYSRGTITSKSDSSKQMNIGDVVRQMNEQVLVTLGMRGPNPDKFSIHSFGVQFADVSVDTMTGKVKVNKIVAAHDIGRVLNRMTLENQFEGGIMQGIGYALMEERVIDQYTGKVVTTDFEHFKVPTIMDTPEIELIITSEGDSNISNTGVKGIGEPATIPTAPAIANAVYNAIGVRINSLPITPDKVLNALYA